MLHGAIVPDANCAGLPSDARLELDAPLDVTGEELEYHDRFANREPLDMGSKGLVGEDGLPAGDGVRSDDGVRGDIGAKGILLLAAEGSQLTILLS